MSDPLPARAPHFFTEIDFTTLQGVRHRPIVRLGMLARENEREDAYLQLVHGVRYLQWAQIASYRAQEVDRQLVRAVKEADGQPVLAPTLRVQHLAAVVELIAHTKASLDVLASFLAGLLDLDESGGDCDFRRARFKDQVAQNDTALKRFLKKHERWLDPGHANTESIVTTRDEWLHRSSPELAMLLPVSPGLGAVPIPRRHLPRASATHAPLSSESHWSTADFTRHHVERLTELVNISVGRAVSYEESLISEALEVPDSGTMSLFAIYAAEDMTVDEIRYRP